jgi:hypothetical protein
VGEVPVDRVDLITEVIVVASRMAVRRGEHDCGSRIRLPARGIIAV